MDREIPESVKHQRRKRLYIRLAIGLSVLLILVFVSTRLFESSIKLTCAMTGTVERGPIEISVNCSGTIVPLLEEIISAPISSRITEVYKKTGDPVTTGEPLLKLELAEIETQHRQKLDEREMMASKLIQLRVRTENSISELDMQLQVGEMQLRQLETELEGEKHLQEIGAGTPDKVRRAELAYEESKLKQEQLGQKIVNERRNADAELRVHELELSILEKGLDELSRLLKEARIMSPRDATLTFINDQIGYRVAPGERIAVISDLTRFKVEAEIAERHREKLSYGGRVEIRLQNGKIPGSIYNINPAVSNGIITFTVVPDNPGHAGLTSGIKTEVDVVYGRRQDVLRVPNGKWYSYGKGDYIVWVIRDGKAERRQISTGESSYEYVEVISGLSEGETMITADMERYGDRKSLKIK